MRKRRARRAKRQGGQVLVQAAMALLALLALVGLVVDGGLALASYRRAQLTMDTAAQAAAHAIDLEVFAAYQVVQPDPVLARARALWVIRQNAPASGEGSGPRVGRVQVVVGARSVVVTAEVKLPTFFMRMFGIPEIRVAVRGTAYPAYGVDEAWQ